ncbi:MAG TPA: acyl-CoA thioesterase [Actinomycetota bacterium]|nr:acyl-CoA thioesterase [Actinomycetota bacterium]
MSGRQPSKKVSDSVVVLSQVMGITDANLQGNVHGGVIMKLVDTAAGTAAARHAGGSVVTAAIDGMSFLHPVLLGNLVTFKAAVNDAGRTSMEVGVRVEAEDIATGRRVHTSSAYLVFVALDDAGKPRSVPGVTPETEDEKRRQRAAAIRREARLRRQRDLAADERSQARGD